MMRRIILVVSIILLFASPALADKTYYFSTDGSDAGSNNCETYSSPCKSIERLNDLMDDITQGTITQNYTFLLEEGDTWTYDTAGQWASSEGSISAEDDYINIRANQAGDGSYRIIIGAYASADGSRVTTSSNRPKIDYNASSATAVINARYGPDYITIENIHVYDYDGVGIQISGESGDNSLGVVATKNKVETGTKQGILFARTTTSSEISYNVVTDVGRQQANTCGNKDETAIYVGTASDGVTVKYNDVYDVYGECYGAYYNYNDGGNPIIFEYNRAINCFVGMHAGDSYAIARYNMVGNVDYGGDGVEPTWGTNSSRSYPNCEAPKGGIQYASSRLGSAADSVFEIYGNLIYGNRKTSSYGIGMHLIEAAYNAGDTYQARIYNNTIVDCYNCLHTSKYADDGKDVWIYNNICTWVDESVTVSVPAGGIDYVTACDYNLWEVVPADSDCDGVNDPANADAQLTRTSGWLPLTRDTINASDFAPQEGSPVIDAGLNLGATYDDIIASSDFSASPPTVTTGDQDDYGPPGQATLQAEPDGEDLNPTLETNAYVEPTAGVQPHTIGAVLENKDHLYTIWELDEDTVPGDDCTNGVDWVGGQASKSYTDLLSHSFVIEGEKTYCWRATFGNVAGDGTVSAVDQFTTTGSATGITITLSTTGNKKITGTISEVASKKVTLTIRQ